MRTEERDGQQTIYILTPGEHFLYLPLYFARSRGFFGWLPSGYTIDIRHGKPDTKDRNVLEAVLNDSAMRRKNWFALCDPMPAFDEGKSAILDKAIQESKLAVLGGLLTTTTFWAIDHTHKLVTTIDELAVFDHLIGFKEGSTAHRIITILEKQRARKGQETKFSPVEMHAKVLEKFEAVEQELAKAMPGSTEFRKVLALTPNPLDAISAEEEQQDRSVVYNFGISPDFSNVVVTALMCRKELADEHSELASGLVRALQHAITLVVAMDRDVVDFAADKYKDVVPRRGQFTSEAERTDEARHLVSRAIAEANRSDAYSASLTVSRSAWFNAFRIARSSSPQDKRLQMEAKKYYDALVRPHRELARVGAANSLRALTPTRKRVWHPHALTALVAVSCGTTFGVATDGVPALSWTIGAAAVMATGQAWYLARRPFSILEGIVHFAATLGLAALLYVKAWPALIPESWALTWTGALVGVSLYWLDTFFNARHKAKSRLKEWFGGRRQA